MKKKKIFQLILRALRETYRHVPKWATPVCVLLFLLTGAVRGLSAPFLQNLIDAAVRCAGGNADFSVVIVPAVIYLLTELAMQGTGILEMIIPYTIFLVYATGSMTAEQNLKAGRMEPIAFDDSQTLDLINRASRAVYAFRRITHCVLRMVLCEFVSIGILMVYFYRLRPILCLIPIFIAVPMIYTQLTGTSQYRESEEENAPLRRESEAYIGYVGSRESAKETRTLGAVGYFRRLYQSALAAMNRELWKSNSKYAALVLIGSIISLAGFGVSLWILMQSTAAGIISIGAFAAVLSSLSRLSDTMENLFVFGIGDTMREIPKAEVYFDYMALPERNGDETPAVIREGIHVRDLHFRYPGKEDEALSGINLDIRAGETVAIVGENGSGKSTLVKLLLGLYLPESGSVCYDNRDVREYAAKALVRNTSAVFQNFSHYGLSVKDNVAVSDLNRAEKECGLTDEVERVLAKSHGDPTSAEVVESLGQLGLDVTDTERFPEGVDTSLAREFDGIDLSGGQWQRVAIARGLYRGHSLIALDEPTAAIDPLEESKLYRSFAEISRGKTALLVTHRLGSVRIADRILVLDKGRIVQEGRHEELIQVPGRYRELWEAQSEWYQGEAI